MAEHLKHDGLDAIDGLRHGFFTRRGGVSGGIYDGLNVGAGSDDDPSVVKENRTRCATAFEAPADALTTVWQVHGDRVVRADAAWPREEAPKADALVSDRPGVMLGILTADCAPLLFADRKAGVIGAAHAGWKGAVADIGRRTVEAMEEMGADRADIVAVIGPCIAQASYEVGPDFPVPFREQDADNDRFFIASAREGHHMFDLGGYVEHRLTDFGIGQVDNLARDTCAEEDYFFSYRRATLRGEADYGRQLSAIMLKG